MTDQNPYGQQSQPGQPNSQPGQQPQQPYPGQVPPQGYYQQPPVPKKAWYKRPIIMIPLTLVVLFVLFVGGCTALFGKAAEEVNKDMNAEHAITYQVAGEATDANVTYSVGDANTTQENGVAAGWSKEVSVTGWMGASLIATNGMDDSGSITCQILVNGQVINENTAVGQYASASCSASTTDIENASK
ncbi:MAG: MmpS family protein [Corynebacterium provencense]|jgi:hypothetical protein|uniref:MmpS family transport accessory protein n=1 Tax=Corynebacterium provencense TaxID=1737425 RepID=UPI002989C95E|nr:MmpS family protein [Corynebacterium provencense]